jgi:hypothetical protein
MSTSPIATSDLIQLFGLTDLSPSEQESFVQDISNVLIEAALMIFFNTLTPVAAAEFETWITTHESTTNFLAELTAKYPDLKMHILAEVAALTSEVDVLIA